MWLAENCQHHHRLIQKFAAGPVRSVCRRMAAHLAQVERQALGDHPMEASAQS